MSDCERYSVPGEQQYLTANDGRFDEIMLGINLDGVGYRQGKVAYSLYGCPADTAASVHNLFSSHSALVEGDPWSQGDHAIFLMKGVPALAMTSERVGELMREIVHTPKDTPDLIDTSKLVEVALALRDLILHLDQL